MDLFAITTFVICDEILRIMGVKNDPQSKMSNSEIMTFTIIAAKYHYSNHRIASLMCKKTRLFPRILSSSRMNRRIHNIPWHIWVAVFRILALIFKNNFNKNSFAVDSFPISSCQKCRIDQRKIFTKKEYIGYSASKKKYFCGVKIHMIITSDGKPLEMKIQPGSMSDIGAFRCMEIDLPKKAIIYADGAYNCFELEDMLYDDQGIYLFAKRGSRCKNRKRSREIEKMISRRRQVIEGVFNSITDLLPRNIRFRTEKGFLLKIISVILAYSFSCLQKMS